jgi:hypothetical protein
LVNFGVKVVNSTFRSPAHNWAFEDSDLQEFQHVFTDDTRVTLAMRSFTASTAAVLRAFGRDWSTYGTQWGYLIATDYSAAYVEIFQRITTNTPAVLAVGFQPECAHADGIKQLLPGATLRLVPDCRWAMAGSSVMPPALVGCFDLVLVSSSVHSSVLLGVLSFITARMSVGGILLVEGVSSADSVPAVSAFPGAYFTDSGIVSQDGDVGMLVYEKS